MYSETLINKAMSIVSVIDLPEEFGCWDDTGDDISCEKISEQLANSGMIQGDFFVTHGISKLVIIADELPFVIKIPYRGRWCCDWYNEETDEYEDYFAPFAEACDHAPNDYCRDELEKVELLNHFGFGQITVETYWLCNLDGIDVYIQEKVKCGRDKFSSSEQTAKRLEEVEHRYRRGPIEWLGNVFEYFGEAFWKQFVDWNLADEDHYVIDDLHSGNVGLTYTGRPVIFDLSGFRD